jgi:hypothetical protein
MTLITLVRLFPAKSAPCFRSHDPTELNQEALARLSHVHEGGRS